MKDNKNLLIASIKFQNDYGKLLSFNAIKSFGIAPLFMVYKSFDDALC